jgi:hypothetical protein
VLDQECDEAPMRAEWGAMNNVDRMLGAVVAHVSGPQVLAGLLHSKSALPGNLGAFHVGYRLSGRQAGAQAVGARRRECEPDPISGALSSMPPGPFLGAL